MVPPTHPDSAPWQRYVALFCGLAGLVIVGVAALNYLVDPYLTHQWRSPALQQLRPAQEKLSAWGKTYTMARLRPNVVYVGNSRTEVGLATNLPMFAGQVVFNGALSGASVGDAIAMAAYAARLARVDTLVWGLDAPSFSLEHGSAELEPELLADGPLFFTRRALFNLKRGLTLDMTGDSLLLLRGRFGAVCRSNLVNGGQRDGACLAELIAGRGGSGAAMRPRLHEFASGAGPTRAAKAAFADSLAALCRAGTRVRLYINPTHALTLDSLYWSGKWAAMEAWQRTLTALAETERGRGCDVRLYDFSGFNSVTSEAIPQVSGLAAMRNYWEASHYRAPVGGMVMARMFPGQGAAPPADFGVELTGATVTAHLAALRLARDRYHVEHAAETAFVAASLALPQKVRGPAGVPLDRAGAHKIDLQ